MRVQQHRTISKSELETTKQRTPQRLAKQLYVLAGVCSLVAFSCAPGLDGVNAAADSETGGAVSALASGDPSGSDSVNGVNGTDNDDSGLDAGGTSASEAQQDQVRQTTTTSGSAPLKIWPLSGSVATTPQASTAASPTRPAVVVKIDNHEQARPQFGINEADLVYEQIVEFGLTRFAAVFHSADVDMVGPVRSVRTSDYALLTNLGVPLFANSGGSGEVLAGLSEIDVVNVGSHVNFSAYWRQPGRRAPYNLMTNTTNLREVVASGRTSTSTTPVASGPSAPLFDFQPAPTGASSSGVNGTNQANSVRGVDLDFGGTKVNYRWQPDANAWWRTQNGVFHLDNHGQVVAPQNIIVQFVVYSRSVFDPRSPQAELLGQGEAWVFTNGELVSGNWKRTTANDNTIFTDLNGDTILLAPGKTWVALARVGQATVAR